MVDVVYETGLAAALIRGPGSATQRFARRSEAFRDGCADVFDSAYLV